MPLRKRQVEFRVPEVRRVEHREGTEVTKAVSAERFWQLADLRVMREHGLTDEEATTRSTSIVVERVLSLISKQTSAEVPGVLLWVPQELQLSTAERAADADSVSSRTEPSLGVRLVFGFQCVFGYQACLCSSRGKAPIRWRAGCELFSRSPFAGTRHSAHGCLPLPMLFITLRFWRTTRRFRLMLAR